MWVLTRAKISLLHQLTKLIFELILKKLDYFRLLSNGILVLKDEVIGTSFDSLYYRGIGLKVFEFGTDGCILFFNIDR